MEPVESSEGRNENDFYSTPQPLANSATKAVLGLIGAGSDFVIEPSAGNGPFVRAVRTLLPDVAIHAIEIRSEEYEACIAGGANSFTCGDFSQIIEAWQPQGKPLVIGNPPFSLAEKHISDCLDFLLPGSHVAFYLKLNFFGAAKREPLWALGQLKYLVPIIGRPSFKTTKKASNDTNEYGIFVWEVGFAGRAQIILPPIRWKEARAKKQKRASS